MFYIILLKLLHIYTRPTTPESYWIWKELLFHGPENYKLIYYCHCFSWAHRGAVEDWSRTVAWGWSVTYWTGLWDPSKRPLRRAEASFGALILQLFFLFTLSDAAIFHQSTHCAKMAGSVHQLHTVSKPAHLWESSVLWLELSIISSK